MSARESPENGSADRRGWWGSYRVPLDASLSWRIGPLTLYARRSARDWLFGWTTDGEPLDGRIVLAEEADPAWEREPGMTFARFGVRGTQDQVFLSPRLADRPVVVRPVIPISVPAREESTLYMSTATWVALNVTAEPETDLLQVPVYRPSDTWFGRDTRRGELCYASRTRAQSAYERLETVPHRAVTTVEIANGGSQPLVIEQVRVPVSALNLYASRDGRLWTDDVTLQREGSETAAQIEIREREDAQGSQLLVRRRQTLERRAVVEAFSKLFR